MTPGAALRMFALGCLLPIVLFSIGPVGGAVIGGQHGAILGSMVGIVVGVILMIALGLGWERIILPEMTHQPAKPMSRAC